VRLTAPSESGPFCFWASSTGTLARTVWFVVWLTLRAGKSAYATKTALQKHDLRVNPR